MVGQLLCYTIDRKALDGKGLGSSWLNTNHKIVHVFVVETGSKWAVGMQIEPTECTFGIIAHIHVGLFGNLLGKLQ